MQLGIVYYLTLMALIIKWDEGNSFTYKVNESNGPVDKANMNYTVLNGSTPDTSLLKISIEYKVNLMRLQTLMMKSMTPEMMKNMNPELMNDPKKMAMMMQHMFKEKNVQLMDIFFGELKYAIETGKTAVTRLNL